MPRVHFVLMFSIKPLHETPAVVFEIEFVEQTPIADPLLQAQEACDEGEGLRECSGMH
jgi:hypothetical protein